MNKKFGKEKINDVDGADNNQNDNNIDDNDDDAVGDDDENIESRSCSQRYWRKCYCTRALFLLTLE